MGFVEAKEGGGRVIGIVEEEEGSNGEGYE